MVQEVVGRFGRLDYLVNCAGKTVYVDMPDLEGLKPEYWHQIMDVNVIGLFSVCRAAAPHLKAAQGSIVNITSVSGTTGIGSSIAYAASKAAAISVTKSLARVMAPEVRVNNVAPGIVLTRWVDGREAHVKKLGIIAQEPDYATLMGRSFAKNCKPPLSVFNMAFEVLCGGRILSNYISVFESGI